jgi:hypothetical protein
MVERQVELGQRFRWRTLNTYGYGNDFLDANVVQRLLKEFL